MNVKIIEESGYDFMLWSLSLSRNQPIENMPKVAAHLIGRDGGHDKSLAHYTFHLAIERAPLRWWKHVMTYRAPIDGADGFLPSGVVISSESTMNSILKTPLTQDDFYLPIHQLTLEWLNILREAKDFDRLTNELPDGYLQTRGVTTNALVLWRMIDQRKRHKLGEWRIFIDAILAQCKHPELFEGALK